MSMEGMLPPMRQAALVPFEQVSLHDIREARLIERHGLPADPPLLPHHPAPPADALTLAVCVEALVTEVYGVHDGEGHPYAFGVMWRNRGRQVADFARGCPVRIQPPADGECRRIPAAVVVPFLFDHFGHTLTEVCSAIYPLLRWMEGGESLQGLPIVVHRQFVPWLSQLTDLLALEPDQVLVPGHNAPPLLVAQLVIPVPTYVESALVSVHHPGCARILLRMMMESPSSQPASSITDLARFDGAKVYLSRSRLPAEQRHLLEEPQLETLLEGLRWVIFHPQEHSLQEQLAINQQARCVCAAQGSALHLLRVLKGRICW